MSIAIISKRETNPQPHHGLRPQTSAQPATLSPQGRKTRDVRLDFFRGISLFVIFVSHVPYNPWAEFIPARFGFSDATEVFVFCSGLASAFAFARVFDSHGFGIGAARIAQRCWQIYWAHIGSFMVIVAAMIGADYLFGTGDLFLRQVGVQSFLEAQGGARFLGLMTLSYVPPYFDILPMYFVILALIPLMMALSRVHTALPMATSAVLWGIAGAHWLELPRDPLIPGEAWFFNPFAWQLVFFTGFALKRGWLPTPPADRRLIALALAYVLICLPLSWAPALDWSPWLQDQRNALAAMIDKTHVGPFRYLHFLSLAYLAMIAAGPGGSNLRGEAARVCATVGGQSLACFMAGLGLSFLASVPLTLLAPATALDVAVVNLVGIGLIILTALAVTWFKSSPWQRPIHI